MDYDIEGNAYKSIKLGDQIWFAENLKVTHFIDGTPIPGIAEKIEWSNLTTPGYCWYNNDSMAYHDPYGALYNWFTIETGNLCPAGWHVPGDPEWQILIEFLGGESEAGGKLKEAGTSHWAPPNEGASNETDFTALPGGIRFYNGSFSGFGTQSFWWSSTENGVCCGYNLYLLNDAGSATRYDSDKEAGISVRCIKDAP